MSAPPPLARGRVVALAAAMLLVAAACGSDAEDDGAGESAEVGTPVAVLEELAPVDRPTDVAPRAGVDDLYVTLQTEGVAVLEPVDDGRYEKAPDLLVDRTDEALDAEEFVEAGVLGLTFSPDGTKMYLVESLPTHDAENERQVEWRLLEYTLDANTVVDGSERVLLSVVKNSPVHNAGQVRFGPDGYLYVGLGDGAPVGDLLDNGQDPFTLLGTVMRIDPTPSADGQPYTIPGDNPFADGVDGAPEVWIYGVRNPWRFNWDADTDDLWLADVGDSEVEEIDLVPAADQSGANLGWSEVEGSQPFEGGSAPPNAVAPLYEYEHAVGFCGIIGGALMPDDVLPEYEGWYLFSDFCALEIFAIDPEGDPVERVGLAHSDVSVTGIETLTTDGRVLVTTLDGLYQLVAAA